MTLGDAGPLQVLLVEDSPSDAALLRESLSEGGPDRFEIVVAETLAQAVEGLGGRSYDVMLLDLSLPDSTGQETFLRARAAAPHLPVVVLTGTEDEAVGLEAVRHGIQDYMVKGQADGRLMARAIRYAIERKQAQEALARSRDDLERLVQERTRELRQTVQELEHFSYALLHDLRAPLRALQGFSQLLLSECGECQSPQNKDFFRRLSTTASRMDRLVTDALSYSQAVRQRLPLAPIDPVPLLHYLIESYPNLQPFKPHIRIEPPIARVLANEAGLTQCLSNLLANAVRFTRPGVQPQIRVRAEEVRSAEDGGRRSEVGGRRSEVGGRSQPPSLDSAPALGALPSAFGSPSSVLRPPPSAFGSPSSDLPPPSSDLRPPSSVLGTVRIWVEDNGIGIPKNFQPRVFDMFQRGTNAQEGTGIGLAIVRKLAEQMGGRVGVQSETGIGSRFWIELPKA